MILYKYLPPNRLDVLEHRRVRFTQPADFNDPFEFRPCIQAAASNESVRAYVEENFEQLVEEHLTKYSELVNIVPRSVAKELLLSQKDLMPLLFRMLEPGMVRRVSNLLDSFLNKNIGVLCLSETRDSILMWGHYTENHQGFVVGFDSEHSFFLKRRGENDEFGFLRKIKYQAQRPHVILSDTTSSPWFETKSDQWAYEREWRIVRVLSDATSRIDYIPFPVYLFEFPSDAVVEIILGMRSSASLIQRLQSLTANFPRANLLKSYEDPVNYGLIVQEIRKQGSQLGHAAAGL